MAMQSILMHNVKIRYRLYIALGLILALMASLVWESVTQTNALWTQTQTMYDHPLKVRRAVGAFETEVTAIHRDMRGLMLAGSQMEIEALLAQIEASQANAFRQLDALEDRYLGPAEDVTALRAEFVRWNTIRDETIRLLRAGRVREATARTKPNAVGGAQAQKLYGKTSALDRFSRSKGDQLFQQATSLNASLHRRLVLYACASLFLVLLIAYLLVTWIRAPLQQITAAADRFRMGSLDARSGYSSTNEFGAMAQAFDAMADTIQLEMSVNEKAAQLTGALMKEMDARAFCRDMLASLMAHTGSQIGAVYLLNPQRSAFEHFESIGLGDGVRAAFSAEASEGEFGVALATGQMQHLAAIPDDTAFTFATVSGSFRPKEIITLPVRADNQTTAVISLASVRAYDHHAIRLVAEVWATVAARLSGVLLFRQTQDFAGRLETQNEELEAQKAELTTQATELMALNAELETQSRELAQASRAKSVFLANMSHELRTPLNSVIALSGVLDRRLIGKVEEEEHGYLRIIERNGRQLLTLINDILDLSRIEAGREEACLSEFSLQELVAEVVETLDPLAQEKGISLGSRIESDLPYLVSDREMVRHILHNLAGNAVKFTPTGSVEITASQTTSEIRIAVADTGIGIAADALSRIFEEFHQVDDSASRSYEGTGLGLAIARKYARLLGGDVSVASVPGRGSTFTVQLPLCSRLEQDAGPNVSHEPGAAAVEPVAPAADRAGRRILLVEDSEAIVVQMTEMLTEEGYTIRTARTGVEALARIAEELPDAVILDLMMPELDGFGTLRAIRDTDRTERLPVLILTARQVTKDELAFLRHNHIHQLIRKGDISREDLLTAVAALFAPSAPAQASPAPPGRRRIGSGMPRVLVIEDNPDNLRTLRALLQETCTVCEAYNGQRGLEQARAQRPDLILTDLAMPTMDGYATLDAFRADASLRDIPVVAVTADAMKGAREYILSRGFDGYLSKPIEAETLKRLIDEVLIGHE